jgi:hypothetical protein
MIFIWLGRWLAWASLILGSMRATGGVFDIATGRYGPGTGTAAIDQGLTYIAVGIVIGLLVQIADRTEG